MGVCVYVKCEMLSKTAALEAEYSFTKLCLNTWARFSLMFKFLPNTNSATWQRILDRKLTKSNHLWSQLLAPADKHRTDAASLCSDQAPCWQSEQHYCAQQISQL